MLISQIVKEIKKNQNKILSLRNNKKLKKDQSFVSKSDIYIESLVDKFLIKKIGKKNYFLLSEENYEKNKELTYPMYIIVLDPIDGTENFVSGLKEWGVSISIYKNQIHYQSCIYLPELDEILKTGDKIKNFDSRIVSLSSNNNKVINKFNKMNEIRITGCCVYNIFNVINGSFLSYDNPKSNVWDILAGINIGIEHNLKIMVDGKKYDGKFLHPNKKYNIKIKKR